MLQYDSLLVLTGIGIPPYSSRQAAQSLSPIPEATQIRRTVNGTAIDISNPAFRKYQSKITCKDQTAPAFDGIWPGATVTVECVAELTYPSSGAPERPEVSGSSYSVGEFISYRPILTMIVKTISNEYDEWGAENGWSIELEEV